MVEEMSYKKNDKLKQKLKAVQEDLQKSEAEVETLKHLLREMVLSKQSVVNELCQTQLINERMSRKLDKQRDQFSAENEYLKREMNHVKSTLQTMQRSLHVSNRKLSAHMRGCAGARFRLGAMFLRMRSTKRWHEKRRNRYQQMCFQFAAYVREQNHYMQAAVEAAANRNSQGETTTSHHRQHHQYLDLLTRCSQLLHENMNLRLLAMDKLDFDGEQPSNNGSSSSSRDGREEAGLGLAEEKYVTAESEETIFTKYNSVSTRSRLHSV